MSCRPKSPGRQCPRKHGRMQRRFLHPKDWDGTKRPHRARARTLFSRRTGSCRLWLSGRSKWLFAPAGAFTAQIFDHTGVRIDNARHGDPYANQKFPFCRVPLFQLVQDLQQLAEHIVIILRHQFKHALGLYTAAQVGDTIMRGVTSQRDTQRQPGTGNQIDGDWLASDTMSCSPDSGGQFFNNALLDELGNNVGNGRWGKVQALSDLGAGKRRITIQDGFDRFQILLFYLYKVFFRACWAWIALLSCLYFCLVSRRERGIWLRKFYFVKIIKH